MIRPAVIEEEELLDELLLDELLELLLELLELLLDELLELLLDEIAELLELELLSGFELMLLEFLLELITLETELRDKELDELEERPTELVWELDNAVEEFTVALFFVPSEEPPPPQPATSTMSSSKIFVLRL